MSHLFLQDTVGNFPPRNGSGVATDLNNVINYAKQCYKDVRRSNNNTHYAHKNPILTEFLDTTLKCLVTLGKDSWNTNEKAFLVSESPNVSINALPGTAGTSIIVSCLLFCRTEITVPIYCTGQRLKPASKPEGHNIMFHRHENPKTSN